MSTEIEVFTCAPPTGESPATDDTALIPEVPPTRASGRSAQNVFIDDVMKRLGEHGFGQRAQIRRLIVSQGMPWVDAMVGTAEEAIATASVHAHKRDGTPRTKGGTFFETARRALLAGGMPKKEVHRIFRCARVMSVSSVKEELDARIQDVASGEVETIPAEQVFAEMDARLAQRAADREKTTSGTPTSPT